MKLTKEIYQTKFETLFSIFNYVPQDGEQIIQCNDNYPPYWFVGNKGYVFSFYGKTVKILKPYYNPKTKQLSYRNAQNMKSVSMPKLIAEHFVINEFPESKEPIETHHIRKRANYDGTQGQLCNQTDNLQQLPRTIHKRLTHYSNRTGEKIDKALFEKVEKAECPVIQLPQKELQDTVLTLIQQLFQENQQMQPIVYSTTLDNDPVKIEAEAHLFTIFKD